MSAGNGKQLRKVYYTIWDHEKKVWLKVSEPSRAERNRRIKAGK